MAARQLCKTARSLVLNAIVPRAAINTAATARHVRWQREKNGLKDIREKTEEPPRKALYYGSVPV